MSEFLVIDDAEPSDQSEGGSQGMKFPPVTVVSLAGKKFVSTLWWQPLHKPRAFKQEAREKGKKYGMDIVAIRLSTIMQAGYAPKGQGAYKGMYSLAAALAAKLGNSWIGAFELPSGKFAFCAVKDGSILPGADKIGDRDEIVRDLRSLYGSMSFDKVYAPSSMEFGGEDVELSQLLDKSALTAKQWKECRLQPLTFGLSTADILRYGVMAAVCAGLLVGWNAYQSHKRREAREAAIAAEQARRAELERIQAQTKALQNVQVLEHPWIKLASVHDFVSACAAGHRQTPLTIEGWGLTGATCEKDTVEVAYKRTGNATVNGFLSDVYQKACGGAYEGKPDFAADYDSVTVTCPLSALLGGDDALRSSSDTFAYVASAFQIQGVTVAYTAKAPEVPVTPQRLPGAEGPAAPPVPPPVPDWSTFTFDINGSDLSPSVIFAGRDWTGVRVKKIAAAVELENASIKWTIHGEIYAK